MFVIYGFLLLFVVYVSKSKAIKSDTKVGLFVFVSVILIFSFLSSLGKG